jgi:ethanolamine utilization protein EutA (predicted chaperonin)
MTYDELAQALLADPRVDEGKMFGMACLKTGGKVFAGDWRGGLTVKVPADRVQEIVASGAGEQFDPGMGRKMREWALLGPEADWVALAREALEFVAAGA